MTPLYFLFSDSNKNNIYIKRDDLIPISFGGNKARKAMNFFKEIDQGGFDCVVTYGSGSSNIAESFQIWQLQGNCLVILSLQKNLLCLHSIVR